MPWNTNGNNMSMPWNNNSRVPAYRSAPAPYCYRFAPINPVMPNISTKTLPKASVK